MQLTSLKKFMLRNRHKDTGADASCDISAVFPESDKTSYDGSIKELSPLHAHGWIRDLASP